MLIKKTFALLITANCLFMASISTSVVAHIELSVDDPETLCQPKPWCEKED